MEKEIIVNNNIIKFENDGIHPNRIYIHEYITNSDCGLEFVLVMSNVFHICAYIKNYDIKKIRYEFDESHPLYQPLLTLLHDKDEIIIDDDNTIYENAKFVKFYKTDKIVMEFVNRLIDEDNKYDFDNFSIYLKNIYPDMHSIVDNKDKKIKYYLAKFFEEAYDALDKYHNKQLIKK